MSRTRIAYAVVAVAACTTANPAFDETEQASGSDSVATSSSTSASNESTTTTTTSGSTTTADTTSGPDESSSGAPVQCAWPDQQPMTFEAAGICETWSLAQYGYLERARAGAWTFYACDGATCNNDCTPVHDLWFQPPTIEPSLAAHGQCVELGIDQIADPRGTGCLTRSVDIRLPDAERLIYVARWGLPANVADLPFASMEAVPQCSCRKQDIECCGDDQGDAGPYTLRVNPLSGTPIDVPAGSSAVLEVDGATGVVQYELVNHRSVRRDCETAPTFEWVVRQK